MSRSFPECWSFGPISAVEKREPCTSPDVGWSPSSIENHPADGPMEVPSLPDLSGQDDCPLKRGVGSQPHAAALASAWVST